MGNPAPRDDIQAVKPYADMPYLIAMEKLLPTGRSFKPHVWIDKIQQAVGDATEQLLLKATDAGRCRCALRAGGHRPAGADNVEEAPAS